MEQRFRRQELHDLVWSEPLAKLAPRFGMSDVALAKTCKRHGIPIPGRSHWAKLKAGKPSPQFPLPPRGLGIEETITIGHTPWNETDAARQALVAEDVPPPPEFIEPLSDVLIRIEKLVGRVPQSRNLKSPHREIAKLLEVDDERREKWRQSSYPSSYDQPFFIAPYEQRRLKLLDAIFNATSRLGMTPSARRRKNPDLFSVKVGDVHVGFKLDKPKEERSTWTSTSEPRRPVTDAMQLDIQWWGDAPEGLILGWTDDPATPLESSLQQIVTHLIAAGEMKVRAAERHRYEQRARHKVELIEAERKRQWETARKERERQHRLESARIEKIFQEAMSLRLADDIRSYVAAVNARNAESSDPVPAVQMADWSHWALEQADRIDPVRTAAFLQPTPEPKEDEVAPTSGVHAPAPNPEQASSAWHPNRWYTRLHR